MNAGELVQSLIEIAREIDLAEAQLAAVRQKYADVEQLLRTQMTTQGIQSLKSSTGETLYLKRNLYVNVEAGKKQDVCEWLRAAGHHDMVVESYQPAALKALVREQLGELGTVDDLPSELRALVRIHEDHEVVLRKG